LPHESDLEELGDGMALSMMRTTRTETLVEGSKEKKGR
jgi:hypothetical protein